MPIVFQIFMPSIYRKEDLCSSGVICEKIPYNKLNPPFTNTTVVESSAFSGSIAR
jgi:hypothetical protein